jgi:Zn-dependent M28 family amino/carboxypeptidase
VLATLLAAAAVAAAAQAGPRDAQIHDPDTLAWWRIAEKLSSDAMEGRDTGSAGYDRAADVVVARFKAAGLKPAGDKGSWFQVLPVHESRVESDGTTIAVVRSDGTRSRLAFLKDVTVRPADDLGRKVRGELVFRGYCSEREMTPAAGRVVICFGTKRKGLPSAAQRLAAAEKAGASAVINIDDPYFTIEPPRWPAAYARTVSLAETPPAKDQPAVFTASAGAFAKLIAGSGKDADAILKAGGAKETLPSFDVPAKFEADLNVTSRDYTAKNVLGVLPGRDPELASQHLVLSAHLDGYGYGEPVAGDSLYNGTLDDAAYVGTLIRFADRHKGKPLARSVVFAAFTGEEKGLLGARYFVRHTTVPKASIVADINLDQLRPLFPLKILTELAVDDSTLGDDAKTIATAMGVRVQPDPEPERNLLERADHWPFMQAGIPATGFIFGYRPGTDAERRYREWYEVRYHRPQDDLTQPVDFDAARAFNSFFYKLAETVADAPDKPAWKPGSKYAK